MTGNNLLISIAAVLLVLAVLFVVVQRRDIRTEGTDTAPTDTFDSIDADRLSSMLKEKDFYFVNVHTPYGGEIAGTDAFIPFNAIEENSSNFPSDKNAKIVVYCRSGGMSNIASQALVDLGYTNVMDLTGGMIAWEKNGYPIVRR